MAPAFVGLSTSGFRLTRTISLALPTGASAGDWGVVLLGAEGDIRTGSTYPAGWTEIAAAFDRSTGTVVVLAGPLGGTTSITMRSSFNVSATLAAYSGVRGIDRTSFRNSLATPSSTITAPGVTVSADESMAVWLLYQFYTSDSNIVLPTGYTRRSTFATEQYEWVADRVVNAGATGDVIGRVGDGGGIIYLASLVVLAALESIERREGSASIASSWSPRAVGFKRSSGAGATNARTAATASGFKAHGSNGSASAAFAQSVDGLKNSIDTGSASVRWTTSATGEAGARGGRAEVEFAIRLAGSGTKRAAEAAEVAVDALSEVLGGKAATGTAQAVIQAESASEATKSSVGAGTITTVFTLRAASSGASAFIEFRAGVQSSGSKRSTGDASAAWSNSITAGGQRRSLGSVNVASSFGAGASGHGQRTSTVAWPVSFAATSSAHKQTRGTASIDAVFVLAADGGMPDRLEKGVILMRSISPVIEFETQSARIELEASRWRLYLTK